MGYFVMFILAVLFLLELFALFVRRNEFKKLVGIAESLRIETQNQADFLNGFVNGTRGIMLPLKMLVIPVKILVTFVVMVFGTPRVPQTRNRQPLSLLAEIEKNNPESFPALMEATGRVIFWSSPSAYILFRIEMAVLYGLVYLLAPLFTSKQKIDEKAVITQFLSPVQ